MADYHKDHPEYEEVGIFAGMGETDEKKMTKVVVTIELDNVKYDKLYGPGSKWWVKTYTGSDPNYVAERLREYKSLEGQVLEDVIVEILHEGLYDWNKEGCLKLAIDGKAVCKSCGRVDGRPHQSYCETVAGAEQSLD